MSNLSTSSFKAIKSFLGAKPDAATIVTFSSYFLVA